MQKTVERWIDMGRAAMARLKRWSWKWWLVVVALLVAVQEAAMAIVGDYTQSLLSWVYRGLRWFLGQPMGFGGLLLFGSLIGLLVLSWWETRPSPSPRDDEAPRALSPEERKLIQHLRTAWNRFGKKAAGVLHQLMREVVFSVEKEHFWGPLLSPLEQDLQKAIDELNEAVAADSTMPLEAARSKFNDLLNAYYSALQWLARLREHGIVNLSGDAYNDRYEAWKALHYDFWDRLRDLHEIPEHNQTLNIFTRRAEAFDRAFAELMREAQTRPDNGT